jgi:DNA-binding HxlR family transcriptional regulator
LNIIIINNNKGGIYLEESLINTIIHPVRLRIIQALYGNTRMTPSEIMERLPDVPQASLYRHLNKLVKSGVIVPVEEKQVRGGTERTYMLVPNATGLMDFSKISKEDHMRYFTIFVSSLLHDFDRYLQNESIDLYKDGVMYRQAVLNMTDVEFHEFLGKMSNLFREALQNQPSPERTARTLTTIIVPRK